MTPVTDPLWGPCPTTIKVAKSEPERYYKVGEQAATAAEWYFNDFERYNYETTNVHFHK